jgi:D-xylose transport system substrate-binding protein
MEKAGLHSGSDFIVQNAQGSTQQQITDAQSDIEKGASVLILDGLDSGTAAGIEKNAKQQGVPVIDYDRVTLKGHEAYYVSFNNYQVGQLLGQGLAKCVTSESVSDPNVYELDGSPTDNNATQFADGYNSVLAPMYNSGTLTKAGEKAVPDWDPAKAQTIFQQAFTANKKINAVLTANDTMNQSVVTVLKGQHAPSNKVPTTGQDAGSVGLQNLLSGYQCMTVYKPIFEEAQAAVTLALYLRAKQAPPADLLNGKTDDGNGQIPSILLQPLSVTTANVAATVAKDPDGFSYKETCTPAYKADCTKYGITS